MIQWHFVIVLSRLYVCHVYYNINIQHFSYLSITTVGNTGTRLILYIYCLSDSQEVGSDQAKWVPPTLLQLKGPQSDTDLTMTLLPGNMNLLYFFYALRMLCYMLCSH